MSKQKNNLTYDSAMIELLEIIEQVDDEDAGVDLIEDKTKRALEIVIFCRNKLKQIEADLRQMPPD